jgi:type 1 glutamine amidotransferase
MRIPLALVLAAVAVAPVPAASPAAALAAAALDDDPDAPRFRALVYSRTAGFRHGSIPAGIEAVAKLGREHDFAVVQTESPDAFTDELLACFDVVVFLNTTQDVLDDDQQAAMRRFVERGGGFAGVHAATDTEYDWAWYGRLVGAYFAGHPRVQEAAIDVHDRSHPSTRMLPERWTRTDEWYNFRESPRGRVTVLASLDETTYEGGTMGDDHPVVWCHEVEGGRAWYTAGGHTDESFAEPLFLAHLLGGIEWAAGADASTGAGASAGAAPAGG